MQSPSESRDDETSHEEETRLGCKRAVRGMAWLCRIRGLGDAPASRGLRARDGTYADAGLFSLSLRDDVDTGACGARERR